MRIGDARVYFPKKSKRGERTRYVWLRPVVVLAFLVVCAYTESNGSTAPYSRSQMISRVIFDWDTHKRGAQGSDNWAITWADNNHQYTAWGDGGGFGGTDSDGRVSLGVARVEGDATSYVGFNVWGGNNSENLATFDGKSYGILSVQGILFMWVSPGSEGRNYDEARLYKSTNHGASWIPAKWSFDESEGMILPTFLQFGNHYSGARDNFVYIYATHLKLNVTGIKDNLRVQKPGEIALMRVPKTSIMNRSAYEFFAGLDSSGNPTWTTKVAAREPVFRDPNGVGWNCSVSYNPGIGRYLLSTEHAESFKGNLGIFDAPDPWGPWTTVTYVSSFGVPAIEPTTFFWNISNKWLSPDGKSFVLIFTGRGSNDAWNTVRGTFVVSSGTDTAGRIEGP